MNKRELLPAFVTACVLSAAISAPARDEAPIAANRTKTVLTIQRVVERNGSKVVAATMQVGVEFGHEFFCSAQIDGHTLSARGIVRNGSTPFFRTELEWSDREEAANSTARANFLSTPGEHHTLASLIDAQGAERLEAFITVEGT